MKSELTATSIVTRSKLEHYGFNMLARPASLRLNKRQSLAIQNQNKKIRANESCHSMQTRSQSSSVCFGIENILLEREKTDCLLVFVGLALRSSCEII